MISKRPLKYRDLLYANDNGADSTDRQKSKGAIEAVTVVFFMLLNTNLQLPSGISLGRWVLLGILSMIAVGHALAGRDQVRIPGSVIALIGFSLLALISTFYSSEPLLTGLKAGTLILLFIGCLIRPSWDFNSDGERWLVILGRINIFILLVTIPLALTGSFNAYSSGSLQGPMDNPNSLGSVLVLTFPGLLYLMAKPNRLSPLKPFASSILSLAAIADVAFVVFSKSRTSAAALLGAWLVYAWLNSKGRTFTRVAGVIVLLALIPLLPINATKGISDFVYKGQTTIGLDRVSSLSTTYHEFLKNPIVGNGFGVLVANPNSTPANNTSSLLPLSDTGVEQTNSILGTAANLGLAGAILLLFALITIYFGAWFRLGKNAKFSDERSVNVCLITIGIAGLINMNGEAWLTSAGTYEALIFWTTTGYLISALHRSRKRST